MLLNVSLINRSGQTTIHSEILVPLVPSGKLGYNEYTDCIVGGKIWQWEGELATHPNIMRLWKMKSITLHILDCLSGQLRGLFFFLFRISRHDFNIILISTKSFCNSVSITDLGATSNSSSSITACMHRCNSTPSSACDYCFSSLFNNKMFSWLSTSSISVWHSAVAFLLFWKSFLQVLMTFGRFLTFSIPLAQESLTIGILWRPSFPITR